MYINQTLAIRALKIILKTKRYDDESTIGSTRKKFTVRIEKVTIKIDEIVNFTRDALNQRSLDFRKAFTSFR